jgi:hypothetical protein
MKYAPLWEYLERQTGVEFEMGFADIEEVIGAPLPASAEQAWWWGNSRDLDHARLQSKAWCKAWQAAGYDATLIRGAQTVKFRKVDSPFAGSAARR